LDNSTGKEASMMRAPKYWLALAALGVFAVGAPSDAQACGGFFCSALTSQPVNQAAERIVFAQNADGTVTAIIQIMYEGPTENFSWLLPISSVPMGNEIAVASDVAFQRLQGRTNPQYNLTTRVEGTCRSVPVNGGSGTGGTSASGGSSFGGGAGAGGTTPTTPPVTVVGQGIVGSFEWTVISINDALPDPADVAVMWLGENGYDVPPGSPALLGPYLEDGLYLLALRLTKGSDSGSIRPIVLTYDATLPMIPIKLTAVAANDNMGVMTWLLGDARSVPQNYLALELNEARINWFNAAANYESVVTAAADDAQGQGFVTEYADATTTLANVVWSPNDDAIWQSVSTRLYSNFDEIFTTFYGQYNQWDGFWDAVRATVTLPANVPFADFQLCPSCYSGQVQFSPSAFIAEMESSVIEPVRLVQEVIDAHPYVTRLYSTMSAAEMTVDPAFTFNPDLTSVSNIHAAERIIECNPNVFQFEAPWRIELPQGGVVRGAANQAGTWPDFTDQPANYRILRQAETGDGRVVEDNAATIEEMLDAYNETIPDPPTGSGGSTSTGGSTSVGGVIGSGGSSRGGSTSNGGSIGNGGTNENRLNNGGSSDSGCNIAGGSGSSLPWAALALALLARRRRQRNV
jgi:MYXO-CTERM domain-containing protein